MTPEELQDWLAEHSDTIERFMDYEVAVEEPDALAETLALWLDNDDWQDDGHAFVSVGADGTGSLFVVWIRPQDDQRPVVFFGSEGSRGVLVNTPEDWAKAIAYAPGIDEDYDGNQTQLDAALNWMLEDEDLDPAEAAERKEALDHYRLAVEARFGALESLEALTDDVAEMADDFGAWVDSKTEA